MSEPKYYYSCRVNKKGDRVYWYNADGLSIETCRLAIPLGTVIHESQIYPTTFDVPASDDCIPKGVINHDAVDHPKHYTSHPSGVECIQITEHMGFNLGNALKYIWRADLKNDAIEDMKKAIFYLNREIEKRESKQ